MSQKPKQPAKAIERERETKNAGGCLPVSSLVAVSRQAAPIATFVAGVRVGRRLLAGLPVQSKRLSLDAWLRSWEGLE